MIGLLARFFKGGLTIPDMERMTWPRVKFWYEIFILQTTEEEIISELSHDKKGNTRKLPPPARIREKVLERIKDRRAEQDGG